MCSDFESHFDVLYHFRRRLFLPATSKKLDPQILITLIIIKRGERIEHENRFLKRHLNVSRTERVGGMTRRKTRFFV